MTRMYWHAYHDILAAPLVEGFEERLYEIGHKPNNEQPLRRTLIKRINGVENLEKIASHLTDGTWGNEKKFNDAYNAVDWDTLHKEQCDPKCPWKYNSKYLENPPIDRWGTIFTYKTEDGIWCLRGLGKRVKGPSW